MTPATLVTGVHAVRREEAIAAALADPAVQDLAVAIILEGLPSGSSPLDDHSHPHLHIARIAPGCLCCTGNLPLRVTLNRMLRQAPQRLYISLATTEHLDALRTFLITPPYKDLLQLTKDMAL